MKKLINFFSPERYKNDEILFRKSRFFVFMIILSLILCATYAFFHLYFNHGFSSLGLLFSCIEFTALLFIFKHKNLSLIFATNIYSFISYIAIWVVVINTGGRDSIIPWFTIITIIPLMTAGKQSGIIWTIISIITYALVQFIKQQNYDFITDLKTDANPILDFIIYFGFGYSFYTILIEYENTRNIAHKKLTELNIKSEAQKNFVIKRQKEFIESVFYAKKIQESILPSNKLVNQYLSQSFILYKPKDIVSGDFYWVTKWGKRTLFAVVDCTGHGVPGAFMSIVGQNILNQNVNEYGLTQPNIILDRLNEGITKTLNGDNEKTGLRDGMDLALCSLDPESLNLQYSGANNPLWLWRKGDIIEIKADKFPIGSFIDYGEKHFTLHEISLQKDDVIYIFSDGFADQFGGEHGKKFSYRSLKNTILEIAHQPLEKQKNILDDIIENWRREGNEEQTDDILIMGVKV